MASLGDSNSLNSLTNSQNQPNSSTTGGGEGGIVAHHPVVVQEPPDIDPLEFDDEFDEEEDYEPADPLSGPLFPDPSTLLAGVEPGDPAGDAALGIMQLSSAASAASSGAYYPLPSTLSGPGALKISSNPTSVVHYVPTTSWDPVTSKDWKMTKPTEQCLLRIKRDIMSIYNEPPPGMFIVPDKDDMTTLHSLITGPFDTPYEGGFFYFFIRCPPDYPIRPPRIKIMTTGGGRVRFNPNLYKNGKVCLSILGTWAGPAWSPALSLSSLLMSIQSLMNEKPYHNEPGFEVERQPGDALRYNDIIRHETLRVAVCDMLEGLTPCPDSLREVMERSFLDSYSHYESVCQSYKHLNGSPMNDPFGERRGTYNYEAISERLAALKTKLAAQNAARGINGEHSDLDSDSDSEDA